jgi:hypothetical protein
LCPHSTEHAGTLHVHGTPINPTDVVLTRTPTETARTHLLTRATATSFHGLANSYICGIMHQHPHGLMQSMPESFLTAETVATIYFVKAWNNNPRSPPKSDSKAFNVLLFNQAINSDWKIHLIPADGYTLVEAQRFAYYIMVMFMALDIKNGFQTSHFLTSMFGAQLTRLFEVTFTSPVIGLWHQYPHALSYWYIHAFWQLFRSGSFPTKASATPHWATIFYPWSSLTVILHRIVRGTALLSTIITANGIASLMNTLFSKQLTHTILFGLQIHPTRCSSRIARLSYPPDQRVIARTARLSFLSPIREVVVKHPLFELKVDAVGRTPFEALFKSIPDVDFPKLMHNGKPKAICFKCAFPAPYNTCNYDRCVQLTGRGNKTRKPQRAFYRDGHPVRLHIDLSLSEWTQQPSTFWDPCVTFLQNATVKQVIGPTQYLCTILPNIQW